MLSDEQREALRSIGSEGGKTTAKRHGKEHYQKLAAHMNKVREQKKGKKGTQPLKKNSLNMTFE